MSTRFSHITRESVYAAMEEFDRIGLDAMLAKYGSGASRRWYLHYKGRVYDQKVIVRAAHIFVVGKGFLSLNARQARECLTNLAFTVLDHP